jgi:hypothetical protein
MAMKHIHTFESFLNESKMGLNSTIKTSTKEYTWVYQTGKDSAKTAIEINKKLNDLGIQSFISKTTGDTVGIPTKDIRDAFDKVLSKYDNLKQFAYSDGTKNDKNVVSESIISEGAMAEIHMMAQDSKNEADFVKKFLAEYGDKVKDNPETRKWLAELYADTKK